MAPDRRPSMAEVARVAGVSHQTVSRVINNSAGVRSRTRENVEAAIRELGYRPNNAARTLATSRSGLIGVIAVGSFLYGPTSTLAGIEEAARSQSYTTLLSTVRDGSPEGFAQAIGSCLDRAVEVVIVIAARRTVIEEVIDLDVDVPLLVVGPESGDVPGHATIGVDQAEGARLAVEHLLAAGPRRLLLLTGPEQWIDARARRRAALESCARVGLVPEVVEGDWTAERGHAIGLEIASRKAEERPTAVFAANDAMALGMLSAFHGCGIDVPRDLAVIGFDDQPETPYYSPALSTIHQDFTTLGHRVLAAALALVGGRTPDLSPVVPTLVIRESTRTSNEVRVTPFV